MNAMNKPLTVAIAGCGSRGHDTYALMQHRYGDRMKIVAAADLRPERLQLMKDEFGLTDEQCYPSAEEMLAGPRLADILFVCTPDALHYPHAMEGLKKDYHLLLEKPISPAAWQCRDIEQLATQRGRHVVVCHVLRYTPFYQQIKRLLDEGAIGRLACIQANEQVGYWHQAHSFVRGNWRNTEESACMILAKCCHDLDLFLWLSGKHCLRVSSFGSLAHFRPENAPAGAPLRCTDGCPAAESCPYNAVRYYLSCLEKRGDAWPTNVVATHPTKEKVLSALENGPYGRCVYHCDNDVVDHQVVNMALEDGVTVSFTMCGLTLENTRHIRLMGSMGEIFGDLEANTVELRAFGKEPVLYDIASMTDDLSGHAGGDGRMVSDMLDLIASGAQSVALSDVSHSVESHLVAFAAEASRLEGGRVFALDEI